jgi:hypothetical protein
VPPDDPLVDDLADAILDGRRLDWAAAESKSEATRAAARETTEGAGSRCRLRSRRSRARFPLR